jgi:hypothetical protein
VESLSLILASPERMSAAHNSFAAYKAADLCLSAQRFG